MSNEREELIRLISEAAYQAVDPSTVAAGSTAIADAILAAGYVKPRMITTAEELDALGRFAAIMEPIGSVWVNDGQAEDPWASFAEDPFGGPIWTDSSRITLPAIVLHEGDSK